MADKAFDKPSLAREFYRGIVDASSPADALTKLVGASPPVFEQEWLDFKGAAQLPDTDLKKTWSQALAGFANTQGGVLVWGIDARKDPVTKVDAASGLSLVPNPNAFKSRLNELHAQATDPPVLDVEVESYIHPPTSSTGFVICLIPESSFRPHRAEHANRQYYIRALDDFVVPSVSLLRNLFYPQSRCLLVPTIQASQTQAQGSRTYRFHAKIKNAGSASALNASAIANYTFGALTEFTELWPHSGILDPYHCRSAEPIHPGIEQPFFSLVYSGQTLQQDFEFKIQIFAQDAEPLEWHFHFHEDEVFHSVRKRGNRKSIVFEI